MSDPVEDELALLDDLDLGDLDFDYDDDELEAAVKDGELDAAVKDDKQTPAGKGEVQGSSSPTLDDIDDLVDLDMDSDLDDLLDEVTASNEVKPESAEAKPIGNEEKQQEGSTPRDKQEQDDYVDLGHVEAAVELMEVSGQAAGTGASARPPTALEGLQGTDGTIETPPTVKDSAGRRSADLSSLLALPDPHNAAVAPLSTAPSAPVKVRPEDYKEFDVTSPVHALKLKVVYMLVNRLEWVVLRLIKDNLREKKAKMILSSYPWRHMYDQFELKPQPQSGTAGHIASLVATPGQYSTVEVSAIPQTAVQHTPGLPAQQVLVEVPTSPPALSAGGLQVTPANSSVAVTGSVNGNMAGNVGLSDHGPTWTAPFSPPYGARNTGTITAYHQRPGAITMAAHDAHGRSLPLSAEPNPRLNIAALHDVDARLRQNVLTALDLVEQLVCTATVDVEAQEAAGDGEPAVRRRWLSWLNDKVTRVIACFEQLTGLSLNETVLTCPSVSDTVKSLAASSWRDTMPALQLDNAGSHLTRRHLDYADTLKEHRLEDRHWLDGVPLSEVVTAQNPPAPRTVRSAHTSPGRPVVPPSYALDNDTSKRQFVDFIQTAMQRLQKQDALRQHMSRSPRMRSPRMPVPENASRSQTRRSTAQSPGHKKRLSARRKPRSYAAKPRKTGGRSRGKRTQRAKKKRTETRPEPAASATFLTDSAVVTPLAPHTLVMFSGGVAASKEDAVSARSHSDLIHRSPETGVDMAGLGSGAGGMQGDAAKDNDTAEDEPSPRDGNTVNDTIATFPNHEEAPPPSIPLTDPSLAIRKAKIVAARKVTQGLSSPSKHRAARPRSAAASSRRRRSKKRGSSKTSAAQTKAVISKDRKTPKGKPARSKTSARKSSAGSRKSIRKPVSRPVKGSRAASDAPQRTTRKRASRRKTPLSLATTRKRLMSLLETYASEDIPTHRPKPPRPPPQRSISWERPDSNVSSPPPLREAKENAGPQVQEGSLAHQLLARVGAVTQYDLSDMMRAMPQPAQEVSPAARHPHLSSAPTPTSPQVDSPATAQPSSASSSAITGPRGVPYVLEALGQSLRMRKRVQQQFGTVDQTEQWALKDYGLDLDLLSELQEAVEGSIRTSEADLPFARALADSSLGLSTDVYAPANSLVRPGPSMAAALAATDLASTTHPDEKRATIIAGSRGPGRTLSRQHMERAEHKRRGRARSNKKRVHWKPQLESPLPEDHDLSFGHFVDHIMASVAARKSKGATVTTADACDIVFGPGA